MTAYSLFLYKKYSVVFFISWKIFKSSYVKSYCPNKLLLLFYIYREELRRWFLQQELDLFRFRFKLTSDQHKKEFLKENNLNYESVSKKYFIKSSS